MTLVGCVTTGAIVTIWEKPGATEAEEQAIYKKCIYEAEAHTEVGINDESIRQERLKKLRDMCLEANGMVMKSREFVPGATEEEVRAKLKKEKAGSS